MNALEQIRDDNQSHGAFTSLSDFFYFIQKSSWTVWMIIIERMSFSQDYDHHNSMEEPIGSAPCLDY